MNKEDREELISRYERMHWYVILLILGLALMISCLLEMFIPAGRGVSGYASTTSLIIVMGIGACIVLASLILLRKNRA